MPARRKTTPETEAAKRRLFARGICDGMEQTPGYTLHRQLPKHLGRGPNRDYVIANPEPVVWVLRRRVRVPGTVRMQDTDPLVTALWETLPEEERRRSRLFAHCGECPVRFTKQGAIADAARCGRVGMYDPPNARERVSAEVRAGIEPPRLDPQDGYEECVAEVWDELSPLHRRTLYADMRPTHSRREWAREGAPSPEAFRSRVRVAERALARALAPRYFPDEDFSIKTRGRRGFDYARFWSMFG